VDIRLKLAENIVLIGGTVMAKGFMSRLKEELVEKLKCSKYNNLKITKFKFHVAPAYENYIAWLGGKNLNKHFLNNLLLYCGSFQ